MDGLGLFTHGEFLDWDSPNPELMLYTHGEFPRPETVVVGGGFTAVAKVGTGGRRWKTEEEIALEELALGLLLLDD